VNSLPAGVDYYILSRYAICESDAEYLTFSRNGQVVGGVAYQKTIVGTAPGQSPVSSPRDLVWALYLDSIDVTDPDMTITPSLNLDVVMQGLNTVRGTSQPAPTWTLAQIEAAGVVEWDSSDRADASGGGVGPDDVYSALITFTVTLQPSPDWTCPACANPITSQPLAMRWDDASYISTPAGGAAVSPYIVPVQYSTTGNEGAVANHIELACTNPGATSR
jgi:hypothetical protein